MLDFKKRMVVVQKEKVLLLVDNFLGHNMANIASRLNVTQLEFLLPNTISRFQPIDARIIASFKAQYKKLLIQNQIDCIMANRSIKIDVYEAVIMLEKTWRIEVSASTIQNC
jgi:hypothetical protein